ncbi:CHAT domain-containing protein [Agromyces ramosus]|uniref:CHAT domain-containing protein n=1 Tax=Agromyces ramosus TaxID=33879 RepID=A0A4Q7MKK4_9MICO|nr:CHAT domain-containing protein [Agromyces ramosus]RZS68804.1 CHAT domain-containing protein [Agromyces ramosus]
MNAVMELEIGPGPESGSYLVRVLRSVGGGEPSETITLDLDELVDRRPALEASVLLSSIAARRVVPDTEAAIQDVGRRLFESAFTGSVASAYRTSIAVASERGTSVQIALRLNAPGLAALPWEALYDPETQTYLCRKEPLVRNVPTPHAATALAVASPLRVLAMVASPRGLPALDVDGERERLQSALEPQIASGRVELHWLEDVSWEGVHHSLLSQEWHVLHFIGHGTYDVDTDEGVLALVGRDGRADYVTASSLADLLDEAEPTPRLVVLNSCQSGAGGTTDLFSGTAAALAYSGIQAVAAMQFSISDTAALAFARGFYTALAYGRGIDEAMRSGRIGILGMGRGTLEWVTPVLYLRGEGARLFDVVPVEAPSASRSDASAQPVQPAASVAGEPEEPATRGQRRKAIIVGIIAGVLAVGGVIAAFALRPTDGGGSDDGGSESTAELAVPLAIDWVDVGLYCTLGDEFVIEVSGRGWLDSTPESQIGPEGLTDGERPEDRVLADANTGSVIGKLNTTPEIFPVGEGTTYACPAQGDLMLGVNDTDLADNSGEFGAFVTLNH